MFKLHPQMSDLEAMDTTSPAPPAAAAASGSNPSSSVLLEEFKNWEKSEISAMSNIALREVKRSNFNYRLASFGNFDIFLVNSRPRGRKNLAPVLLGPLRSAIVHSPLPSAVSQLLHRRGQLLRGDRLGRAAAVV